jgi:HSP20 family protein
VSERVPEVLAVWTEGALRFNGQHELVLKAELPDMTEEEFEVTVEDNTLTLRGEKKLDTEVTEAHFHRIERSYGSFVRSFALPPTVDAGKANAEYKAGVLTVRLPLREEVKPKQIKVAVAVVASGTCSEAAVAPRLGRPSQLTSGTQGSIDEANTGSAA